MRHLKTSEAAALLNVSPSTLRAWERRFGFPKPQRSPGRHRLYTYGEVAALRDALQEGLSISSAVSRAREGLSADADMLVGVLASFDAARADQAMEVALALRPLNRCVEEVLLPSLDELGRRHGHDSAQWAFAGRWANDWLRRARRLAPEPLRRISVLVGDATRDEVDADAAHTRAFELALARAGVDVVSLSIRGVTGMVGMVGPRQPSAVVIAGSHASDDDVARWAYAVRAAAGPVAVALYRRGQRIQSRVRAGARTLPGAPTAAARELLDIIDSRRADGAAALALPLASGESRRSS